MRILVKKSEKKEYTREVLSSLIFFPALFVGMLILDFMDIQIIEANRELFWAVTIFTGLIGVATTIISAVVVNIRRR